MERLLITKIVAEGNIGDVVTAGIKPDFFEDPVNRQLFRYVREFASEYGKVPTFEALRHDHPSVQLPDATDYAIEYLVDQVRDKHVGVMVAECLMECTELAQMGEFDKALQIMQQTPRRLADEMPRSTVIDLTAKSLETRLQEYEERRRRAGSLLGIPSGFHSIDQATQGFQPEQLITFVGLEKAGKSTLLMLCALAAHELAYRPFIVSFEMSAAEKEMRHAALYGHVSHQKLRTGNLSKTELKRLSQSWRRLEAMPDFYVLQDVARTQTLTSLRTEVERVEPDIVFVDGVYMMQDEFGEPPGSPQALTNLTRGFKRMAQSLKIPIAITTQALGWKTDKRRGLTTQSIGYSSSFGQDSDVVIGVEETDLEDVNKVKILAARSAPRMEKYIRWDWDTGTFEELDFDPFAKPSKESIDAQSGFN